MREFGVVPGKVREEIKKSFGVCVVEIQDITRSLQEKNKI